MSNSIAQRQESAAVIQANEATTVLQVIQKAASDPSCDIEKLERLMAMHERMQAKQAEQQYADAMAAMQQELPAIGERGTQQVDTPTPSGKTSTRSSSRSWRSTASPSASACRAATKESRWRSSYPSRRTQ